MKYKEGDVWTERNKTWTIKNGVKKTISKFSEVRKKFQMPLSCPKCSKSMKHHLDQKMFTFNNCCLDCTIAFEQELRKAGKYESYEKARILANAQGYITDLEIFIKEFIGDNNSQNLVTEDGTVETWMGDASKRFKDTAQPIIDQVRENLNKVIDDQA